MEDLCLFHTKFTIARFECEYYQAPFVMVPGISGTGKDVVFQWDNVIFSPVKENPSNILEFPITFPESVGGFCLPIAPFRWFI